MVGKKGLVFIPDISGFTRFVHETEISHSRIIIQELLELLINANCIGLEVSEIEGDAILFYRYGDVPDLAELYSQVEDMFLEFHRYLAGYDIRRFCQCKACLSAINLSLKVITHYGEFTEYNVKNFSKLIGKDIIVAHQLLKNDIEQHEYWLLTQDLLAQREPDRLEEWMQWKSSSKKMEEREIAFHYTQLTHLKETLKPVKQLHLAISNKVKVLTVSATFQTPIIKLLHASGEFKYRNRWQEGVRSVEEISHFLPRIGTKCRRVMDNGSSVIYASSYIFLPDRIEFSETDEDRINATEYLLEDLGAGKVKLTVDIYIKRGVIRQFLFSLHKKKTKETLERSMVRLGQLLDEIEIPLD
ncbi:DUF2652 domain-containing protein [Taibaiella koreensis]|uniref:DUF2652 domain-containing protein n=1 Tax=Taibaiella koreensis TaxID=1268548 RepID=UPI000E59F158|nr:DUF2652 domain-containing protein [Taibaiella koreensis]